MVTHLDVITGSGLERLDSEVLLSHVLHINRTTLFLRYNDVVHWTHDQEKEWMECCDRRKRGEPIAYIIGTKEWYGREFFVDRSTLIPRPATEILLEETLRFLSDGISRTVEADTGISIITHRFNSNTPACILDIGTGSGILPITLALEARTEKLIGVDSSNDALECAKKNEHRYQTMIKNPIEWIHADGIAFIPSITEPTFIITNPPYISGDAQLDRTVIDFEPHQALFGGGNDGAECIRSIIHAMQNNPSIVGYAMECRTDQVKWCV